MNITFYSAIDFSSIDLSPIDFNANDFSTNEFSANRLNGALLDDPKNTLARLLGLGQNHMVNQAMSELICEQFGVKANPDYPLAALSSQANKDSTAYYLQAEPVHLILQRDCFALSDSASLDILPDELQALMMVLNTHFVGDGLVFELTRENKLLLRLNDTPNIKTSLPEKVIGRNVYSFLPQGADASQWNKIINEIQMLLHEHPINQQREAVGKPSINSVWLSGGGVLPNDVSTAFESVYSNVPYVQKLAQLSGVDAHNLPTDYLFANKQQVLIVLDNTFDTNAWFDVLLNQVRQGATLRLNLAYQEVVLSSVIRPRDLYKHWYKTWIWTLLRKNKTVRQHFQAHFQAHLNQLSLSEV